LFFNIGAKRKISFLQSLIVIVKKSNSIAKNNNIFILQLLNIAFKQVIKFALISFNSLSRTF